MDEKHREGVRGPPGVVLTHGSGNLGLVASSLCLHVVTAALTMARGQRRTTAQEGRQFCSL